MSEGIEKSRLEHLARFIYGDDVHIFYVSALCRSIVFSNNDMVREEIKLVRHDFLILDDEGEKITRVYLGYSRPSNIVAIGPLKVEP